MPMKVIQLKKNNGAYIEPGVAYSRSPAIRRGSVNLSARVCAPADAN